MRLKVYAHVLDMVRKRSHLLTGNARGRWWAYDEGDSSGAAPIALTTMNYLAREQFQSYTHHRCAPFCCDGLLPCSTKLEAVQDHVIFSPASAYETRSMLLF